MPFLKSFKTYLQLRAYFSIIPFDLVSQWPLYYVKWRYTEISYRSILGNELLHYYEIDSFSESLQSECLKILIYNEKIEIREALMSLQEP
jgi:hypothetical protein